MEMQIERLDHLGVVAGVIKEVGMIELINEQLGVDAREEISPGEAVAGMILNGLGFSNKPLSLTPRFFEHKPLALLFGREISAASFNRSKLGRILDELFSQDCSQIFYKISSSICLSEKIDMRFNSEDTTSMSLSGEYDVECDEQAIKITHGYSKDYRSDLKQVVHEMMVSQDGGVPLMMKSWDGNSNDNTIFKERAACLVKEFQKSEVPRYLIADSKLYFAGNAEQLKHLLYITRIPGVLKEEQRLVKSSIEQDEWLLLDNRNKYKTVEVEHYGIAQRWIVVYSSSARERAEKSIKKAIARELETLQKMLRGVGAQVFTCQADAKEAVKRVFKKIKYYKMEAIEFEEIKKHKENGRPKKEAAPCEVNYKIKASYAFITEDAEHQIKLRSCYVLGTNAKKSSLSDEEVILAYKGQNKSVENIGFRFLKDPLFFTSSLFIKKPERIEALLMIMTLSLLIYSIAQRRMRNALKEHDETLPNQIGKQTQQPTLRWLFQLLDNINVVYVMVDGKKQCYLQGMCELKRKIIRYFGEQVRNIYLSGEAMFCQVT